MGFAACFSNYILDRKKCQQTTLQDGLPTGPKRLKGSGTSDQGGTSAGQKRPDYCKPEMWHVSP